MKAKGGKNMDTDQRSSPATEELLLQIQDSYQQFLSACENLSSLQALKPGVCGAWSAKAVVDHLTGWQDESLSIVETLLAADQPDLELDIDAFNQSSVLSRENLTWEESLAAFIRSFDKFIKNIEGISGSHLRNHVGLSTWLKAMIHEYQHHLVQIQSAQEY